MNRNRLWVVSAAVLVLLATLLWVASSRQTDDEIPTFVVQLSDFVHRVPAEGVLKAVKATPITPPPDAQGALRIAWMAQDGARVEAQEVVIRFDPSELEKQQLDAAGEVSRAELKLQKHETEAGARIRNLGRDAEAAGFELEIAKKFESRDELIHTRIEIIESELDSQLAEQRKQHADSSIDAEAATSRVQADLFRLEKGKALRAFQRAQAGLDGIEVRAPHAGVLVVQRNWQGNPVRVGDMVWGQRKLMEIPDLSTMEAEVFVLEADAGGLQVGDAAQVVIEAFPDRVFAAEVQRVASLAKPRLSGSPVQYFSVTLKLAETVGEIMRPGQRVLATLFLDELVQVPVIPRQALFERDGEPVVFRRASGGVFEPVRVEIGASGLGRVAVASGLDENDVLALADPTPGAAAIADENESSPAALLPGGGSR